MIETSLLNYIDAIDRLLRWVYRVFGHHVRRISVGPIGVELKGPSARTYDDVVQKLGTAHTHMADAIGALDDLKLEYSAEMRKVEQLRSNVEAKKAEYANARADLEATKQLLAADRDRLRVALGINDTRSKVVGFVSGVLASLVAAVIWRVAPIVWGSLAP